MVWLCPKVTLVGFAFTAARKLWLIIWTLLTKETIIWTSKANNRPNGYGTSCFIHHLINDMMPIFADFHFFFLWISFPKVNNTSLKILVLVRLAYLFLIKNMARHIILRAGGDRQVAEICSFNEFILDIELSECKSIDSQSLMSKRKFHSFDIFYRTLYLKLRGWPPNLQDLLEMQENPSSSISNLLSKILHAFKSWWNLCSDKEFGQSQNFFLHFFSHLLSCRSHHKDWISNHHTSLFHPP